LGLRRSLIQGNHFTCDPTVAGAGVQFGSASRGIYDLTIVGNDIRNCPVGISNGNGAIDRVYIKNNIFLNAYIEISGGLDANLVASVDYPDTIIHGTSIIDGNSFIVDGAIASVTNLYSHAITVGQAGVPYASQESYTISNNTLTVRKTYCTGGMHGVCSVDADCTGQCAIPMGLLQFAVISGGTRWAPSTPCTATPAGNITYLFPIVYNGYYYKCTTAGTTSTTEPTWNTVVGSTTADGSTVWTNAGRKPVIVVTNNTIHGPDAFVADYHQANQGEVTFRRDSDRDAVHISNLTANYPWILAAQSGTVNQPVASVTIPATAPYGDLSQFLSAPPTVGYYPINTLITNTRPGAGARGWVATRAGRAGSAWQSTHGYGFGDWVVAMADNGHAFTQRRGRVA
jgi:hypothetical protein